MKKNTLANTVAMSLALILGFFASNSSRAHNQAPATIRRSMAAAFKTLDAQLPSNVFKGKKSLKVAGGTAQVFEAKKDQKVVGYVAQIEYQEEIHVVAVNASSKSITSVVKSGTALSESEWKELPFVEAIRKALVESGK